eukprot:snap_masked-scaffold_5-processed-gene-12.18-mRNA-1 protein AED:0.97 eAED:1.00 QI:0/-1/0/1/-1/1/1/0/603
MDESNLGSIIERKENDLRELRVKELALLQKNFEIEKQKVKSLTEAITKTNQDFLYNLEIIKEREDEISYHQGVVAKLKKALENGKQKFETLKEERIHLKEEMRQEGKKFSEIKTKLLSKIEETEERLRKSSKSNKRMESMLHKWSVKASAIIIQQNKLRLRLPEIILSRVHEVRTSALRRSLLLEKGINKTRETLKDQLNAFRETTIKFFLKIKKYDTKIADQKEKRKSEIKDLIVQNEKLEYRLCSITKEKDALVEKTDSHSDKLLKLEQQLDINSKNYIFEKKKLLFEIKSLSSSFEQQEVKLETCYNAIEKQRRELLSQSTTFKVEFQQAKNAYDTRIKQQKGIIERKEHLIIELNHKLRALENEGSLSEAKFEKLRAIINRLKENFKVIKLEKDSLKSKLQEQKNQIKRTNKEDSHTVKYKERIQKLENELNESRIKLKRALEIPKLEEISSFQTNNETRSSRKAPTRPESPHFEQETHETQGQTQSTIKDLQEELRKKDFYLQQASAESLHQREQIKELELLSNSLLQQNVVLRQKFETKGSKFSESMENIQEFVESDDEKDSPQEKQEQSSPLREGTEHNLLNFYGKGTVQRNRAVL